MMLSLPLAFVLMGLSSHLEALAAPVPMDPNHFYSHPNGSPGEIHGMTPPYVEDQWSPLHRPSNSLAYDYSMPHNNAHGSGYQTGYGSPEGSQGESSGYVPEHGGHQAQHYGDYLHFSHNLDDNGHKGHYTHEHSFYQGNHRNEASQEHGYVNGGQYNGPQHDGAHVQHENNSRSHNNNQGEHNYGHESPEQHYPGDYYNNQSEEPTHYLGKKPENSHWSGSSFNALAGLLDDGQDQYLHLRPDTIYQEPSVNYSPEYRHGIPGYSTPQWHRQTKVHEDVHGSPAQSEPQFLPDVVYPPDYGSPTTGLKLKQSEAASKDPVTPYWKKAGNREKSKLKKIMSTYIESEISNDEIGIVMTEHYANLLKSKDESNIKHAIELMSAGRVNKGYYPWFHSIPDHIASSSVPSAETQAPITWFIKDDEEKHNAIQNLRKWSSKSAGTIEQRATKKMTDVMFNMATSGNEVEELQVLEALGIQSDKFPPWMETLSLKQILRVVEKIAKVTGMEDVDIYYALRKRNATLKQSIQTLHSEDEEEILQIYRKLWQDGPYDNWSD
jgi:hypothetical protein